MQTKLANAIDARRPAIDEALDKYTSKAEGCPDRLSEAIRYSVLAPGKRMRPLLALFACEAIGKPWQEALPVACAVEFIHVYSLIHDDLPAMDNDDLRRGQATCHRRFDEATAILAGDSLQMLAFELLCRQLPEPIIAPAVHKLALAAGRCRLVGGQADDLAAEGRFGEDQVPLTLESLQNIHRRKTGALIVASLELGGLVAGADDEQQRRLVDYGEKIGLAFQIVDDCLDVESTPEQMGKQTRKDDTSGKLTYPGIMGVTASRSLAQKLIGEAIDAISVFKEDGENLIELANFVVDRRS